MLWAKINRAWYKVENLDLVPVDGGLVENLDLDSQELQVIEFSLAPPVGWDHEEIDLEKASKVPMLREEIVAMRSNMTVKKRIITRNKLTKYTHKEFGEAVGVTRETFTRYENGDVPIPKSRQNLIRYAYKKYMSS